MSLLGAWVPGLPHLLKAERSPQWTAIKNGFQDLKKQVDQAKPDVLVIYSSQWLGVLGTSFQVREELKGVHVDENWYEWGDLDFDFRSDRALGIAFKSALEKIPGLPARTVDYEEFPIDTGTIVANRFLNPEGRIPVCLVSSWCYADSVKSRLIGKTMAETVATSGKKAVFISSSLLSARYATHEIIPADDVISNPSDELFNQKILEAMEDGNWELGLQALSGAQPPLEMQFNAYHWLRGALERNKVLGTVHGYGPIWGTGAAVVGFEEAK